jgi:hypothetical protein
MKVGDMIKFIGDVFDDLGCFAARHDFDRLASALAKCAEAIDPSRMEA